MFKTLIEKKYKKFSADRNVTIFERLTIIRFGSEKAAKEIVTSLAIDGVLTDEGMTALLELMYLDKFFAIFQPLLKVKGFKSLFQELTCIKPRAKKVLAGMNNQEIDMLLHYFENFATDETISDLLPFSNGKSRRAFKWIENSNVTSKERIAKEIGIDKETLNKWLKFYFKRRFDNSRKITLKEYFEIMLRFSLTKKDEVKTIKNDIESFSKRLETDLVHNRSSLLTDERLEGLNEKSLKENLDIQKLDSDMKKIPFSLKEKIIGKMS